MSASQLELPYSEIHVTMHRASHVDSEEATQYERRRISRELEPIDRHRSPNQSSERLPNSESYTSLRSRNASLQSAHASQEHLRRQASTTSTQPDFQNSSEAEGSHSIVPSIRVLRWHDSITNFWNAHISITIDEGSPRDHLGTPTSPFIHYHSKSNILPALERTFLGYLRTSLIFVMTGVVTAQLFRLQRSENPDPDFGFYVIGTPLSVMFIGMAIVVLLVGAFRFWRLQNALVRGKARTGGWEVLLIMGLSLLVSDSIEGLSFIVDSGLIILYSFSL
jgi:uncharacterized membrane protein YidH (DUF202 family)